MNRQIQVSVRAHRNAQKRPSPTEINENENGSEGDPEMNKLHDNLVRDDGVAGSNPATPTRKIKGLATTLWNPRTETRTETPQIAGLFFACSGMRFPLPRSTGA